jgi:AraC-like DNA-binding protein
MATFKTYSQINDLHNATGFDETTPNPSFHVFNTSILPKGFIREMPPYCQEFYQLGLNYNMTGTSFSLQSKKMNAINKLLFFVAPGQVITWEVADITDGFLLYFKKEFFDFYRGNLEEDFPFFNLTDANYVLLSNETCQDLYYDLEQLRKTFKADTLFQHQQLQGLTMAFLFKCRGVFEQYAKEATPYSRQQHLYNRYIQLVNRFFLEYRTIEEYAALLNITPNYLSSLVKAVSGRSTKSFLDDRMITESKNLLMYTPLSVAQIADQLHFSEPTHFIRFFKKHTQLTPTEFRQQDAK